MKRRTTLSAMILFVAAFMLSGCIFPYWDDGYRGGYGGGHRDNGNHGGKGRR